MESLNWKRLVFQESFCMEWSSWVQMTPSGGSKSTKTIESSKDSLEPPKTPKRNPSHQLRLHSPWKPHETPSAPLTHPFSSTDRDGTIHTLFPFIHIFRRLQVYCARQRKDGPTISMNSLNRYAFLLSTVVARTPSRRIRFHNIQTRFVHRTISKLILFHISAFVLFWLTSIFTHSGVFWVNSIERQFRRWFNGDKEQFFRKHSVNIGRLPSKFSSTEWHHLSMSSSAEWFTVLNAGNYVNYQFIIHERLEQLFSLSIPFYRRYQTFGSISWRNFLQFVSLCDQCWVLVLAARTNAINPPEESVRVIKISTSEENIQTWIHVCRHIFFPQTKRLQRFRNDSAEPLSHLIDQTHIYF